MLHAFLIFWAILTMIIVLEARIVRVLIYLGVFSLVSALCYLLLGSADVAMAEAAATAFTTVFFIVYIEKYFGLSNMYTGIERRDPYRKGWVMGWLRRINLKSYIPPIVFTAFLFGIFVYFMPEGDANPFLKNLYITQFMADIGGTNAVTAIYLGYRVYDTLFEALVLIISITAAIHLSAISELSVKDGHHSELEKSGMTVYTMRAICPLLLVFGIYIVANGHISPGGGFQGGLAIASFFICRYMVYNIYDLPISKLNKLEDLIFVAISLIAIFVVFLGGGASSTAPSGAVYLTIMNALIGLKVACGFIILFYRFVAIERE